VTARSDAALPTRTSARWATDETCSANIFSAPNAFRSRICAFQPGPLFGGCSANSFFSGQTPNGYSFNAYITSPFSTISGFTGSAISLVGVFNTGLPWQVFEIGAADTFAVPEGANTLYLGIADTPNFSGGPGAYGDAPGNYQVNYPISGEPREDVPEPGTLGVLGLGLVGLAAARHRRI
jgi:hypothetical protein